MSELNCIFILILPYEIDFLNGQMNFPDGYSIYAVSQEAFLEDFDDPNKPKDS